MKFRMVYRQAAMLAGMLCAAFLAMTASALADEGADRAFGDWMTANGKAVVRLHPCEQSSLCGDIIWLRDELSGHRVYGPSGAPIRGARILYGFEAKGSSWLSGHIFALNQGRTYRAKVAAIDPLRLRVEGCLGPFCGKQIWTRVEFGEDGPRPSSRFNETLVATVE